MKKYNTWTTVIFGVCCSFMLMGLMAVGVWFDNVLDHKQSTIGCTYNCKRVTMIKFVCEENK